MQYAKLWEIAELVDWNRMITEYMPLAVGVFVVTAVVICIRIQIGRRVRIIEIRLNKMETEINILRMQESRHLMMELNAKSKSESPRVNPDDTSTVAGPGHVAPAGNR